MQLFLLKYPGLAWACLHGGAWCPGLRLPPAPLDVPCWAGGPLQPLGLLYSEPPACISPDSLPVLVLMLVKEKINPSSFLNTVYVLGKEREMCMVMGVRWGGSTAAGARAAAQTKQHTAVTIALQSLCQPWTPMLPFPLAASNARKPPRQHIDLTQEDNTADSCRHTVPLFSNHTASATMQSSSTNVCFPAATS